MLAKASRVIIKTKAEVQSGYDRVRWAEGLIKQLPSDHDGRNSWLLNYGISAEANELRAKHTHKPAFIEKYMAAETVSS